MELHREVIDDADLGSAVGDLHAAGALPAWALVTTLDSGQDVAAAAASFTRWLGPRSHTVWRAEGRCVVLSRAALMDLVHRGFFNGFDELWLGPEPVTTQPPLALRITADRGLRASTGAEAWVRDSGCVTGLGDGFGLVLVTADARHRAVLTSW